MNRSFARNSNAGFTLLEMLMSVSLLALIITLAYGSLRVAVSASRSGERLIDRTEEMRTTQGFMRRQFSQLMNTSYERLADSGEEKRFYGDRHRIQFVAPMPGYLSRGGAHVQQLELVNARAGMQLEFRHAQLNGFDPLDGFPSDQEPVVLIDGIREGRFEFRKIEDDGTLGEWSDLWESEHMLPLMLRLDLQFDQDDQRSWPQFEVATRGMTRNATMTFDSMRPPGVAPVNPRPREAQ